MPHPTIQGKHGPYEDTWHFQSNDDNKKAIILTKINILYVMDFIYYAMPTYDIPPPDQEPAPVRSRYADELIYPTSTFGITTMTTNDETARQ